MTKKSEADLAKADLIQTIRTILRLKANIKMRHDLNEVEDEAIKEFERRLSAGESFVLDVKEFLAGEVG